MIEGRREARNWKKQHSYLAITQAIQILNQIKEKIIKKNILLLLNPKGFSIFAVINEIPNFFNLFSCRLMVNKKYISYSEPDDLRK